MKDKKKWWLLLFLLLIIFVGIFVAFRGVSKPVKTTTSQLTKPPAASSNENKFENQESREITLNFKDTYVVLTGYPYVDKDYRPRLYNLIYVDTIFEPDDMVNLTDPSGKWANVYEFSKKEPRIYMPIGRASSGVPIWQTMELVNKENAESMLGTCQATPYALTGGLKATAYACQMTEATKEFAGSVACFVAIDEKLGMLYRQFSADSSVKADMCEVLKNNYIFSIKLKPFN